jgi:competence protein ComEA
MNNHLREYFTFTKKERTGIIVLLVLILLTSLSFHFIATPSVKFTKADYELLQQQLGTIDSAEDDNPKRTGRYTYPARDEEEQPAAASLFAFDPNTLSAEGWEQLGVRARTAQTIRHYIAKGGHFRQPEDLRKIYGLKPAECDRLIPYVRIQAAEPAYPSKERPWERDSSATVYVKPAYLKPSIVDINTADTTAFIALRGIGSKLASRIIHFREKLGGFYAVEQVGETYGLPDSTFQQIRQWLQCPSPAVTKLNINTADAATLQQHPYIRWQVANAIVQYRQQHGRFHSVEQLLQINIITPEILAKMAPYLVTETGE